MQATQTMQNQVNVPNLVARLNFLPTLAGKVNALSNREFINLLDTNNGLNAIQPLLNQASSDNINSAKRVHRVLKNVFERNSAHFIYVINNLNGDFVDTIFENFSRVIMENYGIVGIHTNFRLQGLINKIQNDKMYKDDLFVEKVFSSILSNAIESRKANSHEIIKNFIQSIFKDACFYKFITNIKDENVLEFIIEQLNETQLSNLLTNLIDTTNLDYINNKLYLLLVQVDKIGKRNLVETAINDLRKVTGHQFFSQNNIYRYYNLLEMNVDINSLIDIFPITNNQKIKDIIDNIKYIIDNNHITAKKELFTFITDKNLSDNLRNNVFSKVIDMTNHYGEDQFFSILKDFILYIENNNNFSLEEKNHFCSIIISKFKEKSHISSKKILEFLSNELKNNANGEVSIFSSNILYNNLNSLLFFILENNEKSRNIRDNVVSLINSIFLHTQKLNIDESKIKPFIENKLEDILLYLLDNDHAGSFGKIIAIYNSLDNLFSPEIAKELKNSFEKAVTDNLKDKFKEKNNIGFVVTSLTYNNFRSKYLKLFGFEIPAPDVKGFDDLLSKLNLLTNDVQAGFSINTLSSVDQISKIAKKLINLFNKNYSGDLKEEGRLMRLKNNIIL